MEPPDVEMHAANLILEEGADKFGFQPACNQMVAAKVDQAKSYRFPGARMTLALDQRPGNAE